MGFKIDGLGTYRTFVDVNSDILLDENYDNFRYISFNNDTSFNYGLIMSGSTPLSIKTPKRSTITIPYSHGSLDTSWQDGQLYFNDREITYNFGYIIDRLYTSSDRGFEYNDEVNHRCQLAISEIECWLQPCTDFQTTSAVGDLVDSHAGTYHNARCTRIDVSKAFSANFCVLSFKITFKVGPHLTNTTEGTDWQYVPSEANTLRNIIFGSYAFASNNWILTNSTPLSTITTKRDEVSSQIMDGSIDRSYVPYNNNTNSARVFYEDRTINYTFNKIWEKQDQLPQEKNKAYNKWMQGALENLATSLYSINTTQTWDNVKMKGVASIFDSAYPNRAFMFARCTGISYTKTIANGYWILGVTVQFTTYPFVRDTRDDSKILL